MSGPFRASERVLDMLPGLLAWMALGGVVLGAVIAPVVVLSAAALLAAYSAVRFVMAGAAHWRGLRLIEQWEHTDWAEEYQRRADSASLDLESVHHVVIIPNYQEELDILHKSLMRLADQACAHHAMTIVLAMEAREPGAYHKGRILEAEFAERFANFLVVSHPTGLTGEMACKSANQAWAARWAKRHLVDEMGYRLDDLVVTAMDSDTLWHPRYFEVLSVLFATDPNRYSTFWQAPIRYHGNVWATNPLMRILHAYSSAWELAYLAASWWQSLPMSSYSMSMRLVDRAGYWDPDVIADEWHMFIKVFFQRRGEIYLQPIFLPFHACATAGTSLGAAIKERYLQTLRHAWGAKEIGYTIAQIWDSPKAPRARGFGLLLRVAHDNLLGGSGWIVMTLGAQIPVLLHPALLTDGLGAGPLVLLQISLMVVTALTIAFWVVDLRLRPSRPTPWTTNERIYELASLPLLALMTTCCVALPVMHAQTRLMMGMPIQFRVAAKK